MQAIMQRALDMVGRYERHLAAMRTMCVYRLNGVCWRKCEAREFCRPEENGLMIVEDLEAVGAGLRPA